MLLGLYLVGMLRLFGSIGVLYVGIEAKLIGGVNFDEGELIVRNSGVLFVYYNLLEEIVRCIKDGWYYIGDICRCDVDGFYYFIGCSDDRFISGGENIFPIEIETLFERYSVVY